MSVFSNGLIRMAAIFIVAIVMFNTCIFAGQTDNNSDNLGPCFKDKETVIIECLGDSITEGYTVTEEHGAYLCSLSYPDELEIKLKELIDESDTVYRCNDISVGNFGRSGSLLQENSFRRLSGDADIVIILYTANNFVERFPYERFMESNIKNIEDSGSIVFLMNYPIPDGSRYEEALTAANEYIGEVSENMNILLIDANKYFNDLKGYSKDDIFSVDDIHLTELGYKLLGDYCASMIFDASMNAADAES